MRREKEGKRSMKVKDIIMDIKSGVISVFDEDNCVSVFHNHKQKLNCFMEREVFNVDYCGGNVHIEMKGDKIC